MDLASLSDSARAKCILHFRQMLLNIKCMAKKQHKQNPSGDFYHPRKISQSASV